MNSLIFGELDKSGSGVVYTESYIRRLEFY